ncbi:MAG: class I SAM-dependent methyltransferase [Planctomycetota bacterium]
MSVSFESELREARRTYPRAVLTVEGLLERSARLLRAQLEFLVKERAADFWPEAERLVGLSEALGGSPADALLDYTVAYLKEQVQFMTSGQYSHSEFDLVRAEVYDNPEVMEGFYLHGLLLTHAFWPIHLDIHRFFTDEFLSRLPSHGEGAEFGFGHGLYLLDILRVTPRLTARGYDISPSSRRYAERLLAQGGIAQDRFMLDFADVREPLPLADGSCAWAVFAEVLEHIPDPLAALHELRRILRTGAPLFVTTVMNSNALDHLFLYTEVEQVHAQLREAGFRIEAEAVLTAADYGAPRDPSTDVACVCVPA